MKHAKKLMAALFAVVMLIAMMACSPQMTLEQKMQKALENMNSMKNADADMSMDLEMGMMGMTVSMQMKGNIVTFTDPVKMKMDMTLNALGQEQTMEMYAQQTEEGITTYANAAGTGWQVQQLSSEEFAEQYSSSMNGSADVFLKAMKDFTQAEGTEEINGRKTIKVEGMINGADIAEALKASGMMDAMGSEMGTADLDMEQLEALTQDMSGMKITMAAFMGQAIRYGSPTVAWLFLLIDRTEMNFGDYLKTFMKYALPMFVLFIITALVLGLFPL